MTKKHLKRWAENWLASVSDGDIESDLKICGDLFLDFLHEVTGTDEGFDFYSTVIYPTMSKDQAVERFLPAVGIARAFFDGWPDEIRKMGESGDWKGEVWLSIHLAQLASMLALNDLVRDRLRERDSGAENRAARSRRDRDRLSIRNDKIASEFTGFGGVSVRAFCRYMEEKRYLQLIDTDRRDCDVKFAKQLRPHGKFLKYDAFREVITPEMRAQKKRSSIS